MKKCISLFLALLMALSAVPFSALAEEIPADAVVVEQAAAPVINSLADDTGYNRGYVYTLRTVRAYEHATRNDYSLTIAKGQTGYVLSRPNAGASKDRVEIRYNLDGKAAVAYVDANKVMYYQGDALETMKKDAAIAAGSIKLNNGSPLPPVRYELVPQPTAEPTPEPTAEPTPEPTAEPVAEVLAPVITPAPIADVNPVETTLPIPGKTVVEEPVEDKFYTGVLAYYNEGYPLSDFDDRLIYDKVYAPGIDLPESAHYPSDTNYVYAFRLTYPEECVSLSVTLQYQFHNTWNSWDGSDPYYGSCEDCLLLFYDGLGNIITGSCHTGGDEMHTVTVHVPGNQFTILTAFNHYYMSNPCYGFKVLSVEPLVETELTRIYANAQGHITLEWNNPAKASRYLIQRAELDPDTNTAGVFSSIKYGNSPTETSFTDTRTTPDTLYVYRIRLYNQVSSSQPMYEETEEDTSYYNKVFYTPFDHASYYSFEQPAFTSGEPVGGTGGLRHTISWEEVPNVSKYQLLRSTSPNGTYGVLTETTDTSVVLSVAGFRPFYYKVRAFASVGGKQYGGGTTAVSDMITVGYPDAVQNIQTSTNAVDPYVTITWDKVDGIDGYIVYRSDASAGTYVRVGATSSVCRFVDKTTTVGQTCFYRVRSYIKTPTGNAYSTTSRPSGTTYAGHPAIPTGLTAAESGSSVNLNWGAVPGATGYAVFRKLEGQSSYTLLSYTTAPSYTDKTCAKGQTYVYSVRAYRLYEGRKLLSLYSDPVMLLKTR